MTPTPTKTVSHEDLRKAAVRWLTNNRHCSVILSELTSAAWEVPDAVGWKAGVSCLIECKVSRADFLVNKQKPTVRGGRGIGTQRYFLCVAGLINPIDLGDTDYGLLWLKEEKYIRLVKEALPRETNAHAEIQMLVSALRRIKTREFLTINIIDEYSPTIGIVVGEDPK